MDQKDLELEQKLYFSKYKPEKKIGEGSFGKIYSAISISTNEKYALKIENKNESQNLLESEAYVLCYLKGVGIPSVKSYGFSGDNNVLVMELLGKSLEDLFQQCGGKFSLKTVCMIAYQMLDRVEFVHNKHIIHRDIKPDNFVVGIDQMNELIYLIDFGLAKKYRSSRTLQHISFKNNKKLTGTARYASINALKGYGTYIPNQEQSRRDDLESIGYVLMYFLRGSLPWQGLRVDKKEDKYKKIMEKKSATSAEELTKGFPTELCEYIKYTRNLNFEQTPDYEYLKSLFKKILFDNKFSLDNIFDWSIVKKKSSISSSSTYEQNMLATQATDQTLSKEPQSKDVKDDLEKENAGPGCGNNLIEQKNVSLRYVPEEKLKKEQLCEVSKGNIVFNVSYDNKPAGQENICKKEREKKKDCSFL